MPPAVSPDAAQLPPIQPEHSGTLLHLSRLLAHAPTFELIFLEYGEKRYRDAIIQKLEQMGHHGTKLIMQLSWETQWPLLDALAALPPDKTPVHLLEFGPWLRLDQGTYYCRTINYARDALPEHAPRPLLIWLEPPQLRTLALEAPDLWSWRSEVLSFIRPSTTPQAATLLSKSLNIYSGTVERDHALQRITSIDTYLSTNPEISWAVASLWKERGELRSQLGDWDNALEDLRTARTLFKQQDDPNRAANTAIRITDILRYRGESETALHMLREDVLPVFEKLGNIRSRAITMGKIADILQNQSQFDEALWIRNEEELPVYDELEDMRERAVTMSKIADILQNQGQFDEALRILKDEVLPVFEKLGDIRERAITMGNIAYILQNQDQFDEALRIRKEEELPVYEKLGDIRSRAISIGRIADILQDQGQFDEALRIRKEEQLPVFEKLGDIRERAVTMGNIAYILKNQGQFDEALRIYKEQLQVFEKLGDIRTRDIVKKFIAATLQQRRLHNKAKLLQQRRQRNKAKH